MSVASTPPVEEFTAWRYPRTVPTLPESYHSVHVPKGVGFWRKALAFAGPRSSPRARTRRSPARSRARS